MRRQGIAALKVEFLAKAFQFEKIDALLVEHLTDHSKSCRTCIRLSHRFDCVAQKISAGKRTERITAACLPSNAGSRSGMLLKPEFGAARRSGSGLARLLKCQILLKFTCADCTASGKIPQTLTQSVEESWYFSLAAQLSSCCSFRPFRLFCSMEK